MSERLDRIERVIEASQQISLENQQASKALSRDVAELVATHKAIALENQEANEVLRQGILENKQAIKALDRDVAQMVVSHQESCRFYEQLLEKLTETQAGLVNMLSSLDEDRPTILRKLNTIEDKIDLFSGGSNV